MSNGFEQVQKRWKEKVARQEKARKERKLKKKHEAKLQEKNNLWEQKKKELRNSMSDSISDLLGKEQNPEPRPAIAENNSEPKIKRQGAFSRVASQRSKEIISKINPDTKDPDAQKKEELKLPEKKQASASPGPRLKRPY